MRYIQQIETLSLVSKILAANTGQKQMLMDIMILLEKQLSYMRGTILLLSKDESILTIEAVNSSSAIRIDKDVLYMRGEGIVGQVVATGEPAIIPDISEEPQFRDRIHRRRQVAGGDWSFICVPIKIENEIVGTFSIDIPCELHLNLTDEFKVLTIVSGMIANDVKMRRVSKLEKDVLEDEILRLRDALGDSFKPENIIGNSKSIRDVYLKIHLVSKTNTTVLIRGESGTGKELIASAIHYGSPRSEQKFIKLNCAALNENLLESELFGHEKGSFTGALSSRIGRIEEAGGGTLFLDEIGEISHSIQVKLLRFLQEREFERVGSNRTIKSDVRIIAATNRNLEDAIKSQMFRSDLYYRINVFPVYVPPLRERKEDILPLSNHFVIKFSQKLSKSVRRISTAAINMLMEYHWPGNIRELENCIEHAVIVSDKEVIHGYDLPATLQIPGSKEAFIPGNLKLRISSLEKDAITDALKHAHGNVSVASKELGYTSRMIRYKIKKLKIDYTGFVDPVIKWR
ncbi:MAG: sigma 54-interacting transcriptional regulator [Chitinispirillaceae bacterium]|nr:sigma 54-interacting transcriptional regulator [Chitinispirillaceae bacterium]